MLGNLQRYSGDVVAFRLSSSKGKVEALKEMGVDDADIDESIKYFGDLDVSPESHLDWVFEHRGQRGSQTRFTDGSIPILYTALDLPTAQAEVEHWLPPLPDTPIYYRAVGLDFRGEYKDLRELTPIPDYLTGEAADGAYSECLNITKVAVKEGLDAFKTPSARRAGGVCFPILSRSSVRAMTSLNYIRFTFETATSRWLSKSV